MCYQTKGVPIRNRGVYITKGTMSVWIQNKLLVVSTISLAIRPTWWWGYDNNNKLTKISLKYCPEGYLYFFDIPLKCQSPQSPLETVDGSKDNHTGFVASQPAHYPHVEAHEQVQWLCWWGLATWAVGLLRSGWHLESEQQCFTKLIV